MAKKKMKLWLKLTIIFSSIIVTLGAAVGGFILTFSIIRQNRENTDPEHVDPIPQNQLVFAKGRSLYDKDGNILRLKGVNAGNILVTEGWMSPYCCGPLTDSKGNVVTDDDGNVKYPELTQKEVDEALANNTKLTPEQVEDIYRLQQEHWFSKDDFRRVKEVFHMNAIRLPFYWKNFLNYDESTDTYSRKDEATAFAFFDEFMRNCKENDIYCILDLHCAPKTQNGYEHSGTVTRDKSQTLWFDEKAIEATCDIWRFIAEHYKDNELGTAIATYDLLNEPCSDDGAELSDSRHTNEDCFPVFNRIYQAIRATGDKHNITIEGVWMYNNFCDPATYGWENIQYEVHFYNWSRDKVSYEMYYDAMEVTRMGHDYEVPYYVGEFTFFDNDNDWKTWLAYYDKLGYSWTMWAYKQTVVGWWNDSWGLYNYRLYLNNKTHQCKVDLRSASYADIKAVFECSNTTNCYLSSTGETLIEYLSNNNE